VVVWLSISKAEKTIQAREVTMTVATTKYGSWVTHTGTLAEVAAALNVGNVKPQNIAAIFYDGSVYVAVHGKN